MRRSTPVSRGRILSLIALTIAAIAPDVDSQAIVSIDRFDWATPTISVAAESTQTTSGKSSSVSISSGISTLSSSIGGESDGVLSLVNVNEGDYAQVEATSPSGLHITSSAGATVQFILTLDGRDADAYTLHASDGFQPAVDFTGNGVLDSFVLHTANHGPDANVSLVAFSSSTDYSEYQISIPAGSDGVHLISYEDLIPTGQGADMTAVTGFSFFFGAGGGAPGPVDFRLEVFGLGQETIDQNASTEDVVIVNQMGASFLREVWPNDFGTNPQFQNFSAEAADDFEVGPGDWDLVSGQLDGTYFQNVPDNPTIDVTIYSNNNGQPGSEVIATWTLPLEGHNPFRYSFPQNGHQIPEGKYWISYALNSVPGFDGFLRGSGQVFGDDAQIRNPGGGLGCGNDWGPLRTCENGVRSLISELVARRKTAPPGDVKVEKVASDTAAAVGDTLRFTITVTNQGLIESLDTGVQDFFEGGEIVSLSPSQGTCDEVSDVVLGDVMVIACELGLLSPGASATIEAKMVVTHSGRHRNTVHFVRDNFPDSDPSNDWADVLFNVDQLISVRKDAPQGFYLIGQPIPFRIVVKNVSSNEVSGVEVLDSYLRDNLAYVGTDSNCDDPKTVWTNVDGIRCEIGTMAPGEERVIVVEMGAGPGLQPNGSSETDQGPGLNRVEAFSSRGFEDRDEFRVDFPNEYLVSGLVYWAAVNNWQIGKRSASGIDVYLNDAVIADDISAGEAIRFQDVPLSQYPVYLYLVPGDAFDRSSAFDSLLIESFGTRSGIVLTVDSEGKNRAVVLDQARYDAQNYDDVDMAVLHAAPGLPPLEVRLMTMPDEMVIAENLEFGQTSDYVEVETPGEYNLVVTPDGKTDDAEVFRLEITDPGNAYMVVIGPDLAAGKFDGATVYVIDSQGNVVQPAVVTASEASDPTLPTSFALHGNYPNPFNPTTTIQYDVPLAADVSVTVYDALGRTVTSLGTWHRAPGTYAATWNATRMPSGIYFVRMEAGDFVETRKMVLLK